MTKSVLQKSNSQNLLMQLITNPLLIQEVQSLEPEVLKKIIHRVGLEDSSEILLLLTSEQLQEVIDLDTWSNSRPGEDERLDSQRFILWIEMLLEIGADFAAEKVSEMDEDLLTAAISQFIMVMESDELALMTESTEDGFHSENKYLQKALESVFNMELDNYLIMSKSPFQWETVSNLLVSLQKSHSDLIERLLSRIHSITLEQVEEHDGLHNLFKEIEMIEEDVSSEREQRREREGFVSPSSAKAFLKLVQETPLEKIITDSEQDHISKMYFRGFKPNRVRTVQPLSSELVKILNQHGIWPENTGNVLKLQNPQSPSALRTYMQQLRQNEEGGFENKILELNFIANVLLSGYGPQKKNLRPVEAMELAMQICDEALAYIQEKNVPVDQGDILRLFKIGWKLRGS